MKKKITSILLVCLLLAAAAVLTACGETPETAQPAAQETAPAAAEQPEQAEQEPEPVQTQQPEPAEAEAEDPAPAEPEPEPELTEETKAPGALETALSFVNQDAQLLLDALGEPQQKLYEASCSGPGDDGIWVYEDVTVFTYLENGVETVVDAE